MDTGDSRNSFFCAFRCHLAIKARLDIFGVVFVGGITAVGGGILRDIMIGEYPPAVFTNYLIFGVAAVTALLTFAVMYFCRSRFEEFRARIEHINMFFDAIGLAVFSVIGTEVSFTHGFGENMLFSVVLGMLTGVGGGIMRDILTDTTPYIFKKHVYALASIAGSCVYYLLRIRVGNLILSSSISIVLVIVMRMLAAKYRWSLPKIHLDDEESK